MQVHIRNLHAQFYFQPVQEHKRICYLDLLTQRWVTGSTHSDREKVQRKKNKITVIEVSDSPGSQCSRGAAQSSCGCAEITASAGWGWDRRLNKERGGWLQAPLSWAGLDTGGRVKGGAGCLQRAQRAKQVRNARPWKLEQETLRCRWSYFWDCPFSLVLILFFSHFP